MKKRIYLYLVQYEFENVKSHLFKISLIYLIFDKYGQSLFYKNIRNPLPNSLFNEEIKYTVTNNPMD